MFHTAKIGIFLVTSKSLRKILCSFQIPSDREGVKKQGGTPERECHLIIYIGLCD